MILATRGSKLALAQTELVKRKLEEAGIPAEILIVTTKGDRDRKGALKDIGGDGLFIRELEKAVLSGEADAAVHCGKDLPYRLAEGLTIACVPDAADPRDCLLMRKYRDAESGGSGRAFSGGSGDSSGTESSAAENETLKNGGAAGTVRAHGFIIGTGSPRRISEFSKLSPAAEFKNIRGNIDTRIRKLKDGEYDGIVLARAGLERLSAETGDLEIRTFAPEEMIPAPCQGILCIECREADTETRERLKIIEDPAAARRFDAERLLFTRMKADCSLAVGIHAETDGMRLKLSAMFRGKKAERSGTYQELEKFCEEISGEIYE